MSQRTLSVVVPVFNEVECLPTLIERLLALKPRLGGYELELLFVNDGSTDGSADLLDTASHDHQVAVLHLSRNFGHQAALSAGVDYATGDYVCVIDADLQDPPELIPEMLEKAQRGYDVVYAQRRSRGGESWFKKASAAAFYRALSASCGIAIPVDTGDFRLMSRRVVDVLKTMRETHRFIRGMVPWTGFRSAAFLYDRQPRHAGSTKYPLVKMLRFGLDAILSFSVTPLRLATLLGLLMTAFSFAGLIGVVTLRLFTSHHVPGISAVIFVVFLTSGIQNVLLGVASEYTARVYEQVKDRPNYIVAAAVNAPDRVVQGS